MPRSERQNTRYIDDKVPDKPLGTHLARIVQKQILKQQRMLRLEFWEKSGSGM